MAEGMEENSGRAGKQRAIKTREVLKDVWVVDKAQNLSSHLKENIIRTKENAKSVLDDSQDGGTNYAVDRSEDTAETVVYETERGIRKGNEKVKKIRLKSVCAGIWKTRRRQGEARCRGSGLILPVPILLIQ